MISIKVYNSQHMRFFHNWLTLLSQSVPRKFIGKIYGFYVHHLDNKQLSCSYVNYKLEISWKWTCTTIFVGPTHRAYVSWFSYIIRFWVFICYQDCEKVIGFHTFQKCVSHKNWICELATTHQCGVIFFFKKINIYIYIYIYIVGKFYDMFMMQTMEHECVDLLHTMFMK
jgi:hypothetical protein